MSCHKGWLEKRPLSALQACIWPLRESRRRRRISGSAMWPKIAKILDSNSTLRMNPDSNPLFFWLLTLIGTMGTMWGIRAATTWFSTWRARNLPPQAGGDPSDRKWICSILGAPKRQALQREHLFRNWYFGTAPNFCTLRWLVSNAERWYHLWLFGCLEMSVVCQNRRRTDLHVRLLVPE